MTVDELARAFFIQTWSIVKASTPLFDPTSYQRRRRMVYGALFNDKPFISARYPPIDNSIQAFMVPHWYLLLIIIMQEK